MSQEKKSRSRNNNSSLKILAVLELALLASVAQAVEAENNQQQTSKSDQENKAELMECLKKQDRSLPVDMQIENCGGTFVASATLANDDYRKLQLGKKGSVDFSEADAEKLNKKIGIPGYEPVKGSIRVEESFSNNYHAFSNNYHGPAMYERARSRQHLETKANHQKQSDQQPTVSSVPMGPTNSGR